MTALVAILVVGLLTWRILGWGLSLSWDSPTPMRRTTRNGRWSPLPMYTPAVRRGYVWDSPAPAEAWGQTRNGHGAGGEGPPRH